MMGQSPLHVKRTAIRQVTPPTMTTTGRRTREKVRESKCVCRVVDKMCDKEIDCYVMEEEERSTKED